MNEYLHFDKMITPTVVKSLFWLFVVGIVIAAIVTMFNSFWQGLAILVFGPLLVRIYAEMLLVLFQMNNNLTEIKNSLKK